jgi:1-acyl-sn-glycerol-3-phosphate acyltransferase
MAEESRLAEQAKQDGHGANGAGPGARDARSGLVSGLAAAGGGIARAGRGVVSRLGERAADWARERLSADFDDRDPDYIRENLPLAWLLATLWFRGEVRNLGNIPEDRPVLLVGNHSGGNMTPDTLIFTLAFSTFFGVERPFYQLAHNVVVGSPLGQILRKYGTVTASHEHAAEALRSGAALLVYPGGDWEVHRPSWQRNQVDFAGRKGFIRLALDAGVPIVPVVSIGGQETALFLSQGEGLARALRLHELLRSKVLPISIALPWGLNVGDMLGHIPLPAKITIDVLPPIDLREQFGRRPDPDEVYDHVVGLMQARLDMLATERRFPVIG